MYKKLNWTRSWLWKILPTFQNDHNQNTHGCYAVDEVWAGGNDVSGRVVVELATHIGFDSIRHSIPTESRCAANDCHPSSLNFREIIINKGRFSPKNLPHSGDDEDDNEKKEQWHGTKLREVSQVILYYVSHLRAKYTHMWSFLRAPGMIIWDRPCRLLFLLLGKYDRTFITCARSAAPAKAFLRKPKYDSSRENKNGLYSPYLDRFH